MGKPNIVQDYIPIGRKNRPGRANPMTFITVHETGNVTSGADAKSHANYLKGDAAANAPVSWHYSVDSKGTYQHLPENEDAFHAGDGSGQGNRSSIGIEICVNADGDLTMALERAAELVADICNRRKIPIGNVKQHHDWSRKNCPENMRAGKPVTWQTFLGNVQIYMDSGTTNAALEATKLGMVWIVPGFCVLTSGFGSRTMNGKSEFHKGIDIGRNLNPAKAIAGAVVVAAADGRVVTAQNNHASYGNYVVLHHDGGIQTLYAHNEANLVRIGHQVKQGAEIAKVGNTGRSTAPHLHFEVHENGKAVDPLLYVSPANQAPNTNGTALTMSQIVEGSVVHFAGGSVFISSDASTPAHARGKSRCKLTKTNIGARNPYHIVSEDSAGVHGWVSASSVSKV